MPLFAYLDAGETWHLAKMALLFVGACAGHAALLLAGLNWLYAQPLPHRLLSYTRKGDALLILAGPLLFAFLFGVQHWLSLDPERSPALGVAFTAYLVLCCGIGYGVVPVVTLRRLLRREPAAVLEHRGEVVDVAAALGYKPAGDGKYRLAARLPFNQVFQVEFVERTLRLPRLPAAWDGLTILHLTDLHFCGTPDRHFYRHVLERCRAWGEPDLVAVTGDVVDGKRHHRWVVPLLGRLRWKVAGLAILGNHDQWYDPTLTRRRLRRIGLRVLDNRWEVLEVRGQPLVVVGHEGPWFRPGPDLTDCPPDVFRLCLSHTPDNIKWARRHGIDLVLAGHVHGGQIRFPVVGSVLVPSRYSRKYDCGTFDEPPTLMHVSRGLAGQHPLRYNCRPEVTLLVLRAAGASVDRPHERV